MHWLAKELKLKPGKKLYERLWNLTQSIVYEPNLTWIFKIKKFSHNYIYRNAKNTLAENYRTITK
jgi:hypothetical protein